MGDVSYLAIALVLHDQCLDPGDERSVHAAMHKWLRDPEFHYLYHQRAAAIEAAMRDFQIRGEQAEAERQDVARREAFMHPLRPVLFGPPDDGL